MKQKPSRWKPEDIVKPWQPFSGDLDGAAAVCNPSQTFRGDHPAVQRWPENFIRADTPDTEEPHPLSQITYEPRPRKPPPLPDSELAVVEDSFTDLHHGRILRTPAPLP